jgi:hypothetical protein
VQGFLEMRGRYGQYLKGLPGIKPYLQQLVRLEQEEAVLELLSTIETTYRGVELLPEPIRLMNYHENCKL